MSVPPAGDRPPGALLAALLAGTAALVGLVLAADRLGLGPVDDAYITLRYAEHWASGLGLRYQPGPPVEGFTSFLAVLLETAALLAGIEPARVLALVSCLPFALLAALLAARSARVLGPSAGVLLALALVLLPPCLVWAASGMEVGLFALLLVLAAQLVHVPRGAAPRLAAVLVLAVCARPEALALLPLLLLARARLAGAREALLTAGLTLLVLALLQAARLSWFGAWLPTTYHAKVDGGSTALLGRGLEYLARFAAVHAPLVLLALLGALRGDLRARLPLALALVLAAVVVWEGGDHFPLFRFAVPLLPLLFLAALEGLSPAEPRAPRRSLLPTAHPPAALLPTGLLLAALLACAVLGARVQTVGERLRPQLERAALEADFARQWLDLGRWFRDHTPSDTTITAVAIGALGHASRRTIHDPHGLVDPHVAHLPAPLGHGYAGHEKFDLEHELTRAPDWLVLLNLPTPRPATPADVRREAWGTFAQALAHDPRLDEHYELVHVESPWGTWNLHRRRERGSR